MLTTPTPHTNVKNGQPPLDNTRPFMDDTGRLLWATGQLKEQLSGRRRWCGDEPAVSPATRRRLVAFQLGSDVVGVVDACSCARATVRVLAGGTEAGCGE